MLWRGRRIDVTDLALGKQFQVREVRVDQGCSSHSSNESGELVGKVNITSDVKVQLRAELGGDLDKYAHYKLVQATTAGYRKSQSSVIP